MAAPGSLGKLVLVTGITGFVASHVAQQLLRKGYSVRGTTRAEPKGEKLAKLRALLPPLPAGFDPAAADKLLSFVTVDLLDSQEKWIEAVDGVQAVMHVASPFPIAQPTDEQELIKPALEGTLNVLKAVAAVNAKKPGSIPRVVLTSSVAAISFTGAAFKEGEKFNEDVWPEDVNKLQAYPKSKTLAEKAAWDFVKDLPEEQKFELATINPSYVLGPVLLGDIRSSGEILIEVLNNRYGINPRVSIGICDVRNVAAAHILALETPAAAGHRHIIDTKTLWFGEIAKILRDHFGPMGYRIASLEAPSFLIRFAALFDKKVKAVTDLLDKKIEYDNRQSRERLGLEYIPCEQTIIEMAHTLIEGGLAPKKSGYVPYAGPAVASASTAAPAAAPSAASASASAPASDAPHSGPDAAPASAPDASTSAPVANDEPVRESAPSN